MRKPPASHATGGLQLPQLNEDSGSTVHATRDAVSLRQPAAAPVRSPVMKQQGSTQGVEIEGAGIGEISEEDIVERARQFALSDGRHEINASDMENARVDLHARPAVFRDLQGEDISEDDRPDEGTPPVGSGHQVPRLELDDEGSAAEEEIKEGVDEADLDTRVRSRHTL